MIPRVVELQRKPRIYRSSLMRLRKLCAVILRADPRRARSLCILRVIPCCSWREAASRFTWSTRGARVEALGFVEERQEGSHLVRGSLRVTVPAHRVLAPKTLQSILRQAQISVQELTAVL